MVNESLNFLIDQFGVERFRLIGKATSSDWFFDGILANLSYAYEFLLPSGNRVVIELDQDGEFLALSKLFVKEKGTGIGTQIMDALQKYTYREDMCFMVVQVINPEFFNRFEWLTASGMNEYTYDVR